LADKLHAGWRFGPKILIPVMVVLTITIGLAVAGLYWATTRSDQVSVERQMRTTQRAMDDMTARLALDEETVAVWDDVVIHVERRQRDMAWLDENTGDWLNNLFGHEQIYLLDVRDRPVYASIDGEMAPAARFEAVRGDVRHMIDVVRGRVRERPGRFDRLPGQARPGAAVLTTDNAIHNTRIISVGGRPAAVSVMLVRYHTISARRPGTEPVIITLRFLDRAFLVELQRRYLIDAPRYAASPDLRGGEARLPVLSEEGRAIGYIFWRPELPGSRIAGTLVPTTAVSILVMIALLVWLTRRLWRSTGELHETVLQLRASEAQAQHLAFHDTLTGLPNRALFSDRVDHALSRARRGEGMALLLLDLDRFKHVNDTLGHQAGDALIRELAFRLTALVRECDTVARLGGDEFAVLAPGLERTADIDNLCRRILTAVHEPFEVLGSAAFVGVSIGVVTAPLSGLDRVDLMRKADIALYRAKAEGRDCSRLFSEGMDEQIRFRGAIEDDLRAALDSGEGLAVHFQPEMAAGGETIAGLEALLRWNHPQRGLIPPEQFVPIAEETGQIGRLGEWVLTEACKAARRWPHLFIAVNLSPVQFRSAGFAERAIRVVREAGVDPNQIEFEITEGVLLDDGDVIRASLARLRAAGFRIALDDFGTGYSSLSYLRRFEVDKLKIDRSFIQHLGHRVDSASLVSAVLTIGHAMGLTVTAEGVETNEQRQFLTAAGCNQMQGYLFSRAVPAEEVDRMLAGFLARRSAA
jgi:diguanylate cyclase (GGDEF)-like protein